MNEHDTSPSGDERTGWSATTTDARSAPAGQRHAPRLLRYPEEGPGAGVAAGLGAYFGLDPVFFRIAFLMLTFAGGSGVLLYGIGWLVIPAAAPGQTAAQQAAPPSDRTAQWVGIGLIVAAAFWLTGPFGMGGPAPWALALVAIGVILFREDANRRSREAAGGAAAGGAAAGGAAVEGGSPATGSPAGSPPGSAVGGPAAGSPAGSSPPVESPEANEDAGVDEEEAILEEAARLREGEVKGWSAGGWEGGFDAPDAKWAPAPQAPAAPAARRSLVGRATLGVALVAVGILALAENLSDAIAVAPANYVALVLLTVGAGLLVGAWRGGARGLIPVGLLLLPLLAATSVFQFGAPWQGGVGQRMWHPTELADVRPEYELGAGQLNLDLSDVDFAGGERAISASVGLGQLEVVVPDDVDVTVNATAGAGELDLLGETTNGSDLERTVTRSAPGDGSLTLDLESGLGQVTVSRGQVRSP